MAVDNDVIEEVQATFRPTMRVLSLPKAQFLPGLSRLTSVVTGQDQAGA